MQNLDYPFLDAIFTNEAKGILSDLSMQPNLFSSFMFVEKEKGDHAINYIKSIFFQCIKEGSLLVPTMHIDDHLCGYALLFIHPDPKFPKYLHKIYVKEEYRGNGIGGQIIEEISKDRSKICLICPLDKIPFYEKYGFDFICEYKTPITPEFSLSKDLYSGLGFMKNYDENISAPMFHLNDNDIKNILSH